MKKGYVFLYIVVLLSFCLVPQCRCIAISEEQKTAIMEHCDVIKDSLRMVQRQDARTRVYLGGHYEAILTKFIVPLNVKLVENSLSDVNFVNNQNDYVNIKKAFANDFIDYQKKLEELVAMDCKMEPEQFYDKLMSVRKRRRVMEQDVIKISELIETHMKLVKTLMETM